MSLVLEKTMNRTMTSSNGNIFRVTGPLCGEFTGPGEFLAQRPVTRSFDVFFDLRLNKRLSKQPWGWWFETPAWSLWRHRNGIGYNSGCYGSSNVVIYANLLFDWFMVIWYISKKKFKISFVSSKIVHEMGPSLYHPYNDSYNSFRPSDAYIRRQQKGHYWFR